MNEDNRENMPQEQENNNVKNATNNKVSSAIKKRISKSSKANVAKKSLVKVLMPVITYALVFIIILIIIIGIVLFFITMPGMVMDQIKEFARKVGNSVASWFGADTTKQVEDVDIYETLNYLEEMGYDLKGYGFLTDYVGDTDDGVKRDENENIEEAKSDFVASYLVSDNYVYTIKNFNITTDNWFTGLCSHLASLFTAGNSNQYWSRGMIDIWLDGGVLGKEAEYYSVYNLGSIEINADKKTMEIKRGWFNNSMTYNLDGWTGRYGMPIDFLLSVHLATMMPDLAYDMSTGFETIIKLLLHPVGGGEEDDNTAVGYYKIGNTYRSYDEFEQYASSGITDSLNSWRISKKEAMKIMKEFGIKSPDNCTGTADLDDKEITNDYKNYNVTNDSGKQNTVDFYNGMIDKMIESGYDSSDIKKISGFSQFEGMLEDTDYDEGDGIFTVNQFSIYKTLSKTVNWTGDYEGNQTGFYAEIELSYKVGTELDNSIPATISYNNAIIKYSIKREVSDAEIQAWLDENEINNPEEARCNNLDQEECCSVCRKYIQSIYDKIKRVDVSNLKIYQPYISRVIDHWYRDVYFITSDSSTEFVDYDYDYEAITKERWTRYETYNDVNSDNYGEYKLYKTDGTLYSGTQEEADEAGIKVTKKAVTKKIGDMAEDLEWNDINGVLSAYDLDNQTQQNLEPVYPESEDEIEQNVYVNTRTTGNVVQTGEGQRKETNSKIKKMFLENTYFRYDGSKETAEIITALRKKISDDNYYGTIQGSHLNSDGEVEEVDYLSNGLNVTVNGKTYDAKNYSGQVSLNQDSLNAFSMLENEHTLDSDYIYRDFKELIVELGYFEKEELTDETPRLLQWIIPDIGSNGFPSRAIDKNENEYGTMIHSKGDIKASQNNTLRKIAEEQGQQSDAELGHSNEGQNKESNNNNVKTAIKNNNQKNYYKINKNSSVLTRVANVQHAMSPNIFYEVGAATQFKKDTLIETAQACWQYIVDNANRYSYAGASIPVSNGNTVDCSSFVSWILYEYGFEGFEGWQKTSETFLTTNWNELFGWEEIPVGSGENPYEQIEPGDIFVRHGEGTHHVTFVVEKEDGRIYTYDCGNEGNWRGTKSNSVQRNGELMYDCTYFLTKAGEGKLIRIENAKKDNGKKYEGYQGNEAVVSPVTGILLEYGTYTDEDVDSVSGEKYRTNVDFKYGTNGMFSSQNENQNPDEPQGQIITDKVGYAKILVLDKENFKKLEAKLINSTELGEDKLLSDNGNFVDLQLTEDSIEDWKDLDKTLYGYKEFAEMYDEAGIAGNVVYIDGFKCEKPDEEFDAEKDGDDKKPSGEEIKFSDFGKVTLSSFSDREITLDEDDLCESMYQKDEEYKMASKSATEKLNTESMVKEEAISTIAVGNIKFIKEGTVIGRTLTDKEVVEDYGDGARGDYATYRTGNNSNGNNENQDDENTDKIVGNYIRIMMRDTDETVVEDVEDYMKLDDGSGDQEGVYGDLEAIDENSTDAEKIRAAVTYFMSLGFTKEAACGILGNLIQESALDPKAVSSSGYHGLVQWDSTNRWPKVKAWMASNGYNEDSFAGQIRAIYEFERNQMDEARWEELKKLTDVERACELFCVYDERCTGGSDSPVWYVTGNLYQELNQRKQFSHNALDIYMGDDSKGIKDGA